MNHDSPYDSSYARIMNHESCLLGQTNDVIDACKNSSKTVNHTLECEEK